MEVLEQLKVQMTEEQVEDLLVKILQEVGVPMEVHVNQELREAVKGLEGEMRDNFAVFYKKREEVID